jgi:hypothetical protein
MRGTVNADEALVEASLERLHLFFSRLDAYDGLGHRLPVASLLHSVRDELTDECVDTRDSGAKPVPLDS